MPDLKTVTFDARWIAFEDAFPPTVRNGEGKDAYQKVLVTNNIDARDAFGCPSHIWYVQPFEIESVWHGVEIACSHLTHWLDPFAAPTPAAQSAGQEAVGNVYMYRENKEWKFSVVAYGEFPKFRPGINEIYLAPVNAAGQEAIYQQQRLGQSWCDVDREHYERFKDDVPSRIVYAAPVSTPLPDWFGTSYVPPVNASEPVAWVDEKSETLVFGGRDKRPFAKAFKPVFYAAPVNGGERECGNADCGWVGPIGETVHPKHGPSTLLCPRCHETTESNAADAQQVGACSDCGSTSPIGCAGRGCFAHEEERVADAPKMRAGYGETDFGYTFIGVDLEEGDKRLMALLVAALGTEHAAIDDMTNLIFRARALTSPAKEGGDERVNADEIGHPTNRYLFKKMCEHFGITLGECTIAQALATVNARAALSADGGDRKDAERADMFWNSDDPEQVQDSIHNVVVEANNNGWRMGEIVEVQQAIRLENVKVRITTDETGHISYEYIDAAIAAKAKGE